MPELERTSTTITNVFVQGRGEKSLRALPVRLGRIGFKGSLFLMISSGGIVTVDTAIRFPVRLLESGPAAGAFAAARPFPARGGAGLLPVFMCGTSPPFSVALSVHRHSAPACEFLRA